MMDGEQLYPDGHHPSFPSLNVSTVGLAKCLRRRDVAEHRPVKYYFIDFEAAMQFKKPSPKVYYIFGQDPELPELSFNKSFSPYPVDIFMLGNVYRKRLIQVDAIDRLSKSSLTALRAEILESRLSRTSCLCDGPAGPRQQSECIRSSGHI